MPPSTSVNAIFTPPTTKDVEVQTQPPSRDTLLVPHIQSSGSGPSHEDTREANVLTKSPHLVEKYTPGTDKGPFSLPGIDVHLSSAQNNPVSCIQENSTGARKQTRLVQPHASLRTLLPDRAIFKAMTLIGPDNAVASIFGSLSRI